MPIKKVFAYQLHTPLLNTAINSLDDERFDYNRFEDFLNLINAIPVNHRAYRFSGKLINIHSFQDSGEDANFVEGFFISTRYGELQDIINVNTLATTGNLSNVEGVKYQVPFVICKQTGLLLVLSDNSKVVTRSSLDKYFASKEVVLDQYKDSFNTNNRPWHIIDNMFLIIRSIVSDDFYAKVRQLARIKEATVFININNAPTNNAAVEFFNDAIENDVDTVDEISISLVNKTIRTGIRNVEGFIRSMVELEKYDRYEISGYTDAGSQRTVTFENQALAFEIRVDQNENGLVNYQEALTRMVNLAKFQNPLIN